MTEKEIKKEKNRTALSFDRVSLAAGLFSAFSLQSYPRKNGVLFRSRQTSSGDLGTSLRKSNYFVLPWALSTQQNVGVNVCN